MSYDNFTHGGCKVNRPDPKPMTHDEIRTLVDDYREDLFQPAPSSRIAVLLTAIETLLAENAKLRDAIRRQGATSFNVTAAELLESEPNPGDTQ